MRWTEEQYEEFVHARNQDRAARKVAVNESDSCGKPVEEKTITRPDGPVDITIISHLCRLRDTDGCFYKYAIDSIVDCGLLKGDTYQDIREIRHRQVKAKKGEEKTEIIILW